MGMKPEVINRKPGRSQQRPVFHHRGGGGYIKQMNPVRLDVRALARAHVHPAQLGLQHHAGPCCLHSRHTACCRGCERFPHISSYIGHSPLQRYVHGAACPYSLLSRIVQRLSCSLPYCGRCLDAWFHSCSTDSYSLSVLRLFIKLSIWFNRRLATTLICKCPLITPQRTAHEQ